MSTVNRGVSQGAVSATQTEAAGVLTRIEGAIGGVHDLFAEVQGLLAEIQALEPPQLTPRGLTETDAAYSLRLADFATRQQQFAQRLDSLNARLRTLFGKLGAAQVALSRLQGQELPAAQRRDAERAEKALKDSSNALNAAAQSLVEATSVSASEDMSANRADAQVQVRKRQRALELDCPSEPTGAVAVPAFELYLVRQPEHAARSSKLVSVPVGGRLLPTGSF